MLDSRNRTRTIAHLLKYVSPVDLWEFLGDFSLFLYDLDMTGAWRAERLTGENWRRTVERLSQAYPALPRSSSLRPVHSLSAKAAAETPWPSRTGKTGWQEPLFIPRLWDRITVRWS